MSIIEREILKVTEIRGSHAVLDGHTLFNKDRIFVDSLGDKVKEGDLITKYIVDDGANLLSVHYIKEWVVNNEPERVRKETTYVEREKG